jgi:rhodanese-related sulfurtransferase
MTRLAAIANRHPGGFFEIPPEGAAPNLADFRLIDVREPDEFVGPLGHIPGAELVPMGNVLAHAGGWDRTRPVLLVCRSGARSGHVAAALAPMGYPHLYNLIGGMLVWNELGLPVER